MKECLEVLIVVTDGSDSDKDAVFNNLVLGSVGRELEEQFCRGFMKAANEAMSSNVCSLTYRPFSFKSFLGADRRVMGSDDATDATLPRVCSNGFQYI